MKLLFRPPFSNYRTTAGLIISLLLSSPLLAMGIGDVELLSKLGEPLKAQVRLSNTEDLSDEEIIIRSASEKIYKELGVERSSAYHRFRYKLSQNRNLIITTEDPVKEPYLNFILEFRWPEGKIYKEFKLLIDPS